MFDRRYSRAMLVAAAAASFAFGVSPVRAEMMTFRADLGGQYQVPPVQTAAKGQATFSYDTATRTLNWNISYSGLSGPARAGHIHGPAEPGKNAGILIPFSNPASPIAGSKVLTPTQASELMGGLLYVNIHTAAHPGGEIRGNIVK